MRFKRSLAAAAAAGLGLVAVYATAAGSSEGSSQTAGGERTTAPIAFTYAGAIDRGTKYVVSNGGNIINLVSPNVAGSEYDHLGAGALSEGYVLCYTKSTGAVTAFDTGASSAGFAAPVVGTNLVTRTTSDGQMRLVQKFVFNAANKSLNINMTVANIGPGQATNVILRRLADVDTDTGGAQGWSSFQNRFVTGSDFVMGYNEASDAAAAGAVQASGVVLRHIEQGSGVAHVAKTTSGILETTCDPTAHATPTAPEDRGITMQYNMGTIGSTGDRTARVQYVRL